MWVSVLRAKVKPVVGVVEVGRIRVTDQRAPREPVPGKSLRRLQRGPWVSSRARIASKTRARCTRLSACLFVFLPSFVLFLPRSFSSFLRSLLSVSLSHHRTISSFSFPSLEHFCPSPFMNVLPFPSLRTILRLSCVHSFPSSSVVHAPHFLPHSAPSSLLASPSSSQFFLSIFLSSHRSFLARSPPDVPACYLPA